MHFHIPVRGDGVEGLQGLQEVVGICRINVLHCEVVDDEAKCDRPCVVSP
jgi:hypothetical protein